MVEFVLLFVYCYMPPTSFIFTGVTFVLFTIFTKFTSKLRSSQNLVMRIKYIITWFTLFTIYIIRDPLIKYYSLFKIPNHQILYVKLKVRVFEIKARIIYTTGMSIMSSEGCKRWLKFI